MAVRRNVPQLIPANEITGRIKRLAESYQEFSAELHLVAISCLLIAARDGQISPINRLQEAMKDTAMRDKLKGLCRTVATDWLTMVTGEYRVKPGKDDERAAFVERAGALVLEDWPAATPSTREPKAFTVETVAKKLRSIVKVVDKAEGLPPDATKILHDALDRIERLMSKKTRRKATA